MLQNNKLPKNWKIVKLKDITTLSSQKHSPIKPENLFYIGLEHIEKHTGKLTQKAGIDKITTIKNKFSKGDILYGKLRPNLNKVYLSKEDGVCSTDILVLKLSKECLGKYLHAIMFGNTFVNIMSKNTSGVNLPRVSTKIVMNYEIPLPPLETQNLIVSKIEELFSELDKGIEDLKTAQEQLQIYRQSVLKWAFEGKLTKQWRLKNKINIEDFIKEIRLKGKESFIKTKYGIVESDKDEKLLQIPNEWRWIRNEELIFYVTSGSRDWKKYYSSKGSYFIRTQNLNTNLLDLTDAAFVDLPSKVEGKRSLVQNGDLLMTITGANVGKVAYVDHEIPEAYVSQSVSLMKYIDKRMVKYLWYYFQCKDFGQGLISGLVYGMGRPVLNLENMKEVPVALCTLEEQNQIVQEIESRLSVADKMEESITQSLQQAETLRQSILKKAFSGELV